MPITSPHNDKLKTVRKLRSRRRERELAHAFVAEGEDLLEAADLAGWAPLERFATSGSGLPGIEVSAEALGGVAELASGTRTLAIYEQRWAPAPLGRRCLYLHGVGDPGNVGTILRSAAAFGADCVALAAGSADPFGPKAVRASMGAIFLVPVAKARPEQLPGVKIALDADPQAEPLADIVTTLDSDAPVSLLIGAEREGLPDDVLATADHVARIPIGIESLNAAMAATVALYEISRRIKSA
jgi:TrmH family RNA methyltransferase